MKMHSYNAHTYTSASYSIPEVAIMIMVRVRTVTNNIMPIHDIVLDLCE